MGLRGSFFRGTNNVIRKSRLPHRCKEDEEDEGLNRPGWIGRHLHFGCGVLGSHTTCMIYRSIHTQFFEPLDRARLGIIITRVPLQADVYVFLFMHNKQGRESTVPGAGQ